MLFKNLFLDERCPFYGEWSSWSWIKEGDRDVPIRFKNDSHVFDYNQQKNDTIVSTECSDTCGKRVRTRTRNCYEINLKGSIILMNWITSNKCSYKNNSRSKEIQSKKYQTPEKN